MTSIRLTTAEREAVRVVIAAARQRERKLTIHQIFRTGLTAECQVEGVPAPEHHKAVVA
jgi:hypothetical protein